MLKIYKEQDVITASVYNISTGVFICSCGEIISNYDGQTLFGDLKNNNILPPSCPGCGNKNIIFSDAKKKKSYTVGVVLSVESKDDRSFHIRKKEVCLKELKKKGCAGLKISVPHDLKFSLKEHYMEYYRNGVKREDSDAFFKGLDFNFALDLISTEKNRELYLFATNKLGYEKTHGLFSKTTKLAKGLKYLLKYPNLELFNFSGFSHLLYDIYLESSMLKSPKTTPNEILGVPKYMLKYVRQLKRLPYNFRNLIECDEKIGGNNTKIILDIFSAESSIDEFFRFYRQLLILSEDYKYKDYRKVTSYLVRDIKLHQGILSPYEGLVLLIDYNKMCKKMGITPEKYPTSLKKSHDIAMMNCTILDDKRLKEEFVRVMDNEDWEKLLYTGKRLTVVKPKEPEDLIKESDSLSHCVKSYVNDVTNGRCKILFIRKRDDVNESLLTVEIRKHTRTNDFEFSVVQVKGRFNRKPSSSEVEFINEWAKEKNLFLNY